jgi:hypothetical protein
MPNDSPERPPTRRRTAKATHLRLLRLLRLELLADAHSSSPWRAGNSFRLTRAARFEQAVKSRLRPLALRAATPRGKDVCAEAF